MPLIGEARRDAIAFERPHFLDQSVFKFALPFARQKFDDLLAARQKFRTVAPTAIGGVRQLYAHRVAAVPGILSHARFLDSGFAAERWQWRTGSFSDGHGLVSGK